MRILIWHGYLLNGTGSNVYTRALARTFGLMGHEVVVLSQDPDPGRYDLGGAHTVRPRISGPLPVFVLDTYADLEAALLPDMDRSDLDRFVAENAAAIREQGPADVLLVNHVLLGGPVGQASGLRYLVKAHGSELEFSMRGHQALCRWGEESLAQATAILAGSEHIADVLEDLVHPHPGQVHVIPPGVDVDEMRPQTRDEAFTQLIDSCRDLPPNPPGPDFDERSPDDRVADTLASFLQEPGPMVLYVGKLSREKGVDLLLEAAKDVHARLVVVGFGPERHALQDRSDPARVLFTGPLEHSQLRHLWALADVSVTPSVFPEAFGMVAAEAAACGSPPLVARHSGLAEIAEGLEREYPPDLARLASFETGDVQDLTAKLRSILALPRSRWLELSASARTAALHHWSWESVAHRILALVPDEPSAERWVNDQQQ